MAWERDKPPDVVIGLPHQGEVTVEWMMGFMELEHPNIYIQFMRGMPLDEARNKIAEKALELKAKWVFYLDSDTVPPKDCLIRLMSHNLPIVSALYYRRHPPHIHPAMWRRDPTITDPDAPKYRPITEFPRGALVEADVIGMGCCLISRRVFEAIKPPWFEWRRRKPFKEVGGLSEDFDFCEKAKAVGSKILVDTSIVCNHIGLFKVGEEGKITFMRF